MTDLQLHFQSCLRCIIRVTSVDMISLIKLNDDTDYKSFIEKLKKEMQRHHPQSSIQLGRDSSLTIEERTDIFQSLNNIVTDFTEENNISNYIKFFNEDKLVSKEYLQKLKELRDLLDFLGDLSKETFDRSPNLKDKNAVLTRIGFARSRKSALEKRVLKAKTILSDLFISSTYNNSVIYEGPPLKCCLDKICFVDQNIPADNKFTILPCCHNLIHTECFDRFIQNYIKKPSAQPEKISIYCPNSRGCPCSKNTPIFQDIKLDNYILDKNLIDERNKHWFKNVFFKQKNIMLNMEVKNKHLEYQRLSEYNSLTIDLAESKSKIIELMAELEKLKSVSSTDESTLNNTTLEDTSMDDQEVSGLDNLDNNMYNNDSEDNNNIFFENDNNNDSNQLKTTEYVNQDAEKVDDTTARRTLTNLEQQQNTHMNNFLKELIASNSLTLPTKIERQLLQTKLRQHYVNTILEKNDTFAKIYRIPCGTIYICCPYDSCKKYVKYDNIELIQCSGKKIHCFRKHICKGLGITRRTRLNIFKNRLEDVTELPISLSEHVTDP